MVRIYFVGRSERCIPACLDLSIVHKSQTWHPGSKDSPIFYLHPTETVPRSSTSWTDGYFLALSSSVIFRGRTCSSCKSKDQLKTYFCCLLVVLARCVCNLAAHCRNVTVVAQKVALFNHSLYYSSGDIDPESIFRIWCNQQPPKKGWFALKQQLDKTSRKTSHMLVWLRCIMEFWWMMSFLKHPELYVKRQ